MALSHNSEHPPGETAFYANLPGDMQQNVAIDLRPHAVYLSLCGSRGLARVRQRKSRVARKWRVKYLIMALAALTATLSPAAAQDGLNASLHKELLEMGRRDQEVRERLIPLAFSAVAGPPSQTIMTLIEQQREVDEANFRRLDEIVKQYGWPGKTLVGEEASSVAHLLIQHADLDRQKRYLPMLKSAAGAGETGAWTVAMLEDRIRVSGGQNQLYGSNFERRPDGTCVITPIEDPVHLDERRQAVGLPSIQEYLREVSRQLGKPCVMESSGK